ncbi:hypothetical protein PAXINDRAFT_18647 [Paxillus involutus ATCC 200175]|uniref:Uncharacterized protein n=1 Tax=Paxillus involutus ATCC 200175 TaxID=664439 RepID=A0A0C9TAZ2_PAXIN|nr:hypothetical protein PAXINDRAFT_18647 [Paxillus involutus ATCC 200175]
MPPTRTIANTRIHFDNVGDLPIPCGLRSRRPPSDSLKAEYVAYTKESRNILDISRRLEENSPLLDTYSALLQNHRISNVIEFIERTNHRLNHNDWVVSTLEHIRDEQQELLINSLHQMNFEDLVSNIHRQLLRAKYPLPPLVKETYLETCPYQEELVPLPSTMTIEETPRTLPTPPPRRRHYRNNRAQVIYSRPLTHSGTSSSRRQGSGDSLEDSIDVDLSTEQAFGLSVEQVIEATNQAERQEVIDGYPLSPSDPSRVLYRDSNSRLLPQVEHTSVTPRNTFTFILQSFLPSVTYGEAPLAIIAGCYKMGISTIVFASFVVIMLAEAVTVTLTLYRAYHYFQHTPNALVQNMMRDGAFYCMTMFCMSVTNVLVIFLVPLQYVDMITVYQAVMHTILTIRMQLHLRKVNEHTYLGDRFAEGSLVPMSFMRSAFLADT